LGGIEFKFDSQVLKFDLNTRESSVFVPKATPAPDSFDTKSKSYLLA
jgi:hypothetical protein